MAVDLTLRALARTMPPATRDRYLEQWRADAGGPDDAAPPRGAVVRGAVAAVLTADRDSPALTGEERGTVPRRLSRRGVAVLVAAAALLSALWLTGGGAPDTAAPLAPGFTFVLHVLWAAMGVAGIGGTLLAVAYFAATAVVSRRPVARIAFALAALGLVLLLAMPAASAIVVPLGMALVLGGSAVGLAATWGWAAPLALAPRSAPRHRRWPLALAGVAAAALVLGLGAVDTLVWNPLAKVPGQSIDEIYQTMTAADGFIPRAAMTYVTVWAIFWFLLALGVAALAVSSRGAWLTPRRLGILFLSLIGCALFFRSFAGFGIGMSLADTFAISGGDESALSLVFHVIGPVSIAVAAILFGWAAPARSVDPEQTAPAT